MKKESVLEMSPAGVRFDSYMILCKSFKENIRNLLDFEWNKVLKLSNYTLTHHVSIESAFQFVS